MLPELGAVLAQSQFFSAALFAHRVVVVAGLLANEKHGFGFLLTTTTFLGHDEDFSYVQTFY